MARRPKEQVHNSDTQKKVHKAKHPKHNFGAYPELKGWTKTEPQIYSKYL